MLNLPVALLTFSASGHTPDLSDTKLSLHNADLEVRIGGFSEPHKHFAMASAWDKEGFAFKVVGEKLVHKLRAFAFKLKSGEGCFAGTFLTDQGTERLSGVTIALHTQLRPEHKAAIAQAQQIFEKGISRLTKP